MPARDAVLISKPWEKMEEVCASDVSKAVYGLVTVILGKDGVGKGERSRAKRKERCFLLETHVSKEGGTERSEEKEKDGEERGGTRGRDF